MNKGNKVNKIVLDKKTLKNTFSNFGIQLEGRNLFF
jgi:hypothetical protein